MNHKLKKTVASVVITASIMSTGYSALAAEASEPAISAQKVATYKLTEALEVEVKSVLNERVQEGTRLGVVIRMKNNGNTVTRVPEYELRVKTSEGIQYTLQPSGVNAKAIQPKANTELSYMTVIDRTDSVSLTEVNWTDVDVYVYPKKETLIAAAPIQGEAWKGIDTPITNPTAVKKWSESFVIPSVISPIQYTPVGINKESTIEGTFYVVQFLAYNPANKRESVPNFVVDGKTDGKIYSGKRVEQGIVALEAKEQKYIHFAIPVDQDAVLTSINILTPETFAQGGGAGAAGGPVTYNVGRLNVLLPTQGNINNHQAYTLGTPMKFDSLSTLIHPNMEVSVVELHMDENKVEGFNNVTAKFKLANKSNRPIAVPNFHSDIMSADGYQYNGSKQNITTPSVLPNSSLTVSFTYSVPASETGSGLALRVLDAKTAAPHKTTIAAYNVELQAAGENREFSVYPFDVKVRNWTIGAQFNSMTLSYSYKAKFFFDIQRQQQVQVDPSFSHLQFEFYNSADNLLGTSTASFIGLNRLVSGENNISIPQTYDQLGFPLKVRIYEVFNTETGAEGKRLLGEYKQ
ncbi:MULTISPECIES: hypothetical protein [unclassified Paenibacillus]|uniref:hypothetical protein n=1 Tax=unclassified Paenibacillus TaxID=185978 RepID=UPI001AE664F4|nr:MULTISPECIES: hypothetical protein [unclassified Paenibacillus]MBP1156209.1 hypothetical protein [Paenibacillus sp. PvP091]MBP1168405.1 hypothetical protein [Paenibacillus sp. PvR098]MBP2439433.1 hypothetical protein [Paenibacillus sp. PvP052]